MTFDTDKFISCIQNSPSIWEIGSKNFMDRNVKQKSWDTIGEYMFENWSELDEPVKENKGKNAKVTFYYTVYTCMPRTY